MEGPCRQLDALAVRQSLGFKDVVSRDKKVRLDRAVEVDRIE